MSNEQEIILHSYENKLIESSPALTAFEEQQAEEQNTQRQEAFGRYQSRTTEPQADVGGGEQGRVMLTESDDYLPYLAEIGKQVDIGQQQLDDEANSITRDPGTWDGKYVKPNTKTINGIDFVTGEKHKNVYDLPDEDIYRGLEKLRQGRYSMEGGDVTALEGAADLAGTIITNGGTFADYQHIISEAGISERQQRLAYQAAEEGIAQQELEEYIYGDVPIDPEAEMPEETPPEYEREDLPDLPEWMSAASTLYKYETGGEFDGSPEELVDWSINEMANFNWRVIGAEPGIIPGVPNVIPADYRPTSMSWYGVQAAKNGPEYAKALHNLIELYDQVNTDMGIVGSSIGAMLTDPTTYVSFGVGKGVSKLTANVAKERMKGVLTQIAARAAPTVAAGAVEGAAFTGGEETIRQGVAQEAGMQEGYDLGKIASRAGVGLGFGAVAGGVLSEPALDMYKKGGRKLIENYKASQKPSALRRQIGAINPAAKKLGNIQGADERLGTRVPTSPEATENPVDDALVVGIESLSRSDALEKNVKKLEAYDSLRAHPDPNATVEERAEHLKKQIVDNLLWLHDQMDETLRDRAKQWYDGARKQVDRWAKEYGYKPRQVAAAIAALSPQKDWFQNMSMAERVMDITKKYQDFQPNQAMLEEGDRIHVSGKPKGEWNANDKVKSAVWNDIKNKTLGELNTDFERAMWIRAFDQANNPRSHRVWSPEGDMQELATTDKGDEAVVAWGSTPAIASAVSALRDGSRGNISRAIGLMHKVRNFYNNIISPNSDRGEVTVDTHAVAAGLMEPHGGSAPEVLDNLGAGAKSNLTGDAGTYGIFADAYREAAAQRGLLPREMQSITWEEVRTIFDNKSDKVKKATKKVWQQYKNGIIEQDEARRQIDEIAKQASKKSQRTPAWAGRTADTDGTKQHSSYDKELSGDGVPRQDSPSDAGTPGGAARRIEGERSRRTDLRRGVYASERPRWTGDAKVRLFRGKSPGDDSGLRGVKKVWDLKSVGKAKTYNNLLGKTDLPQNPVIHELDAGEMAGTFQASLAELKANNKYGAAVHVYTPDEYGQMRLFQSPDGKSGFAVKPDGDIVSVYSSGGGNVYSMLQLAVEQGGTKLDAFETVLPEIYEDAGFKVVRRLPWSDKHTPDDWDFEVFKDFNDGRPAVVEMEYDPEYTPTLKGEE